jgi:hypothetical protein
MELNPTDIAIDILLRAPIHQLGVLPLPLSSYLGEWMRADRFTASGPPFQFVIQILAKSLSSFKVPSFAGFRHIATLSGYSYTHIPAWALMLAAFIDNDIAVAPQIMIFLACPVFLFTHAFTSY